MAWDIKEGKGSEPPVVLPRKYGQIGPTEVSWFESEPGLAVIFTTGGTIDDRWLAYTVRREELAACGIRHAEFNFDQQQLFDSEQYKTRIPIVRSDVEEGAYNEAKHSNDYPFLYFPKRNQILLGNHGDFHAQTMRETHGFENVNYGSRFSEPHHPGRIMEDGSLHWYEPHLVGFEHPPNREEVENSLGDYLGVVPDRFEDQSEYFNRANKWDDDEEDWTTSSIQKTAAWPDIMAKAKRLIQSGNVTLLRNGTNNVVGHVIGDHGEYQTEISRDDPNSRSITQWTCECPWDQYAFQRTRQWKKYEGRPCAHVLATYWKSLATPVDDQPTGPPPGTQPAGPAMPPGPGMPPGGGIATPQGWQQAPGSEGMVYEGPGGPGGMPMAPSVRGPQLNPALQPIPSFDQPPLGAPQFPGYHVPTGDPRLPNYRIPLEMTPPSVGLGNPFTQQLMDQMAGPLGTPINQFAPPANNGILPPYPLAEQTVPPPQPVSTPGARPGPYPANPLQQPGTFSKFYKVGKAGDEFPPGSAARMEESTLGQSEGREGATDAGQWMEIPKNTMVEVVSQDPTTGWVEVMMPLKGGPMTSYHVRCFVEPEKLTPLPGSRTPFENPKGRFT